MDDSQSLPVTIPPDLAKTTAVVDLAYLEDMRQWVGNGPVMELLAKAPGSLRQDLAEFTAAWGAEDLATVRDTAHRLKGAAGSVGARRLMVIAQICQRMPEGGLKDTGLLAALRDALEEAVVALAALDIDNLTA